MIHIDLFSGIGGFSQGLKKAGFPISKTYFSEIDKYAISVYRRNFPDAEYIGGVESVSGARFKNRKTIITFGFPCQDLSIAGKRRGFNGSRSSLFFEAMRIIEEVKPDIFIFENVKGFYSSNDGKDFQIALQTIADLGFYECEWQLLNTAWFLPQNRERIYFVGHLTGGGGSKVFPIRNSNQQIQKKRHRKSDQAGCISTKNASGQCNFDGSTTLIKTDISTAIDSNYHKGIDNHGQRTMVVSNSGLNRKLETRKGGISKGKTPTLDHNCSLGIDMKVANSVTPDAYLTKGTRKRDKNGKAVLTSMFERRIRRLSPIECERLQGFPDNWTEHGHKDQLISDSQRYKMCGNAVSVPVVKCIGERLKLI